MHHDSIKPWEQKLRVCRVTTDDGQRLMGVRFPSSLISILRDTIRSRVLDRDSLASVATIDQVSPIHPGSMKVASKNASIKSFFTSKKDKKPLDRSATAPPSFPRSDDAGTKRKSENVDPLSTLLASAGVDMKRSRTTPATLVASATTDRTKPEELDGGASGDVVSGHAAAEPEEEDGEATETMSDIDDDDPEIIDLTDF